MVVSHVDVVDAVAEVPEVRLAPLPRRAGLLVEGVRRAGEDAHHLEDEAEDLLVGPVRDRPGVDDLLPGRVAGDPDAVCLVGEVDALPEAADLAGPGVEVGVEPADPPVQVQAVVVITLIVESVGEEARDVASLEPPMSQAASSREKPRSRRPRRSRRSAGPAPADHARAKRLRSPSAAPTLGPRCRRGEVAEPLPVCRLGVAVHVEGDVVKGEQVGPGVAVSHIDVI